MIPSIKKVLRTIFGANTDETKDNTTVQKKTPAVTALSLTDDTFEEKVLKADKPVVVDFFAPWCGPCQQMAPKVDQIASEYDGRLTVVKVDTDVNKRWARHFAVKQIPNVVYFYKGKLVHRTTGNLKIEDLRTACDNLLKAAAVESDED
jgi:thioredoxin 1